MIFFLFFTYVLDVRSGLLIAVTMVYSHITGFQCFIYMDERLFIPRDLRDNMLTAITMDMKAGMQFFGKHPTDEGLVSTGK